MALFPFNLNNLFSATWGYKPFRVEIDDVDGSSSMITTDDNTENLRIENDNSSRIVNQKSKTGNYSSSYYKKDVIGRDVFMPLTLGGLFLPYVWMNVREDKRLVETDMTERRGSVIEMISFENVQIGVKGFVIGHDGIFPEKDIEDLRKLNNQAESVTCESVLTDIFLLNKERGGNDKVVMRGLQILENIAIEHVRGFQFELTSDQILELELA